VKYFYKRKSEYNKNEFIYLIKIISLTQFLGIIVKKNWLSNLITNLYFVSLRTLIVKSESLNSYSHSLVK